MKIIVSVTSEPIDEADDGMVYEDNAMLRVKWSGEIVDIRLTDLFILPWIKEGEFKEVKVEELKGKIVGYMLRDRKNKRILVYDIKDHAFPERLESNNL